MHLNFKYKSTQILVYQRTNIQEGYLQPESKAAPSCLLNLFLFAWTCHNFAIMRAILFIYRTLHSMPLLLLSHKPIKTSQAHSAKMTYSQAQLNLHQEVEITTQKRQQFVASLPVLKQDPPCVESMRGENQGLPGAIASIFSLED